MKTFKEYIKENIDNKPKRDYGTKENPTMMTIYQHHTENVPIS